MFLFTPVGLFKRIQKVILILFLSPPYLISNSKHIQTNALIFNIEPEGESRVARFILSNVRQNRRCIFITTTTVSCKTSFGLDSHQTQTNVHFHVLYMLTHAVMGSRWDCHKQRGASSERTEMKRGKCIETTCNKDTVYASDGQSILSVAVCVGARKKAQQTGEEGQCQAINW